MQDTQKYVGVTPCVFKINKPSYKDIAKSFSIISKRLLMVNLSKQIIETHFIEWQNLCNHCCSDKMSPSSSPIYSPIRVPVRECLQSPIARNNQLAADLPRPCQAANPVFTPASHSFSQPQPAAGKLFSF